MGKLIEGLWKCLNCGRPRDENTKFYMPSEIQYGFEKEESSMIRKPDWICSINKVSTKKDVNNFFKNNKCRLIFIIFTTIFISGLIYLFFPKTEIITLREFKWEREIGIEELRTVKESGWSLPKGAKINSSKLELSHYQTKLDHYEKKARQIERQRVSGYEEYVTGYKDLGNGYSEEITSQRPVYETYYETEYYEEPVYIKEPVYQTKYYYEIDKWMYKRSIITLGKDKNPYWGEVLLNAKERVLSRTENYYIFGVNKRQDLRQFTIDYEMWCKLKLGQQLKMKKSIIGYGEIIEY